MDDKEKSAYEEFMGQELPGKEDTEVNPDLVKKEINELKELNNFEFIHDKENNNVTMNKATFELLINKAMNTNVSDI